MSVASDRMVSSRLNNAITYFMVSRSKGFLTIRHLNMQSRQQFEPKENLGYVGKEGQKLLDQ